ncbi:MAG: hypothetical protein IKR85_07150 [Clostridia bacterium]|nr:hypothetical protein [Clostridia bacterium]
MKLGQIMKLLDARAISDTVDEELEIQCACASDMMSDVLAFPKEHMILLTGLVNPQVMRTCDMLDIRAVVFTRGKLPSAEALRMANEEGISVLATENTQYIASGKLYAGGMDNGTKG